MAGPADWLDQVRRTWEAISPAYADVPTLLTLPQAEGAGPCACWNAAAEAPGTEGYAPQWLLPLLAGDVLREDMLEAPQQAVRHQPEISCISARTSGPDGQPWKPRGFRTLKLGREEAEACLLIRRFLWQAVGGMRDCQPLGLTDWLFSGWAVWKKAPSAATCPARASCAPCPRRSRWPRPKRWEALSQMVIRRTSIFPASSVIKAHEILAGTVSTPFARRTPNWRPLRRAGRKRRAGSPSTAACCMKARAVCPEALLHYRLAAQHDGLDWQPWLRMAHLHARLGQRARVAEDVRRALELRAGLEEFLPAGA